jgi:hypothetical protein
MVAGADYVECGNVAATFVLLISGCHVSKGENQGALHPY